MEKFIIKNNKGFGAVELIITIIIVGIGLVSVISLMTKVVEANEKSRINLIALNLAREAIEAARNFRDSNWLSGNAWDAGMYSSTDYTAAVNFNINSAEHTLNFVPNSIEDIDTKIFYNKSAGVYSHNTQDEETPFSRILYLDLICMDVNTQAETVKTSGASCGASENKIGIQATATVRYDNGKIKRDIVLINKIYNWR